VVWTASVIRSAFHDAHAGRNRVYRAVIIPANATQRAAAPRFSPGGAAAHASLASPHRFPECVLAGKEVIFGALVMATDFDISDLFNQKLIISHSYKFFNRE
jgi:hypothetical protein